MAAIGAGLSNAVPATARSGFYRAELNTLVRHEEGFPGWQCDACPAHPNWVYGPVV